MCFYLLGFFTTSSAWRYFTLKTSLSESQKRLAGRKQHLRWETSRCRCRCCFKSGVFRFFEGVFWLCGWMLNRSSCCIAHKCNLMHILQHAIRAWNWRRHFFIYLFFLKVFLDCKRTVPWRLVHLHSDPYKSIASAVSSIFFPLAACYQTGFVCFTIRCFAENVEITAAWIASGVNSVGFDGICWKCFLPLPLTNWAFVPYAVFEQYIRLSLKIH